MNIQWYPGHMTKTRRQMAEYIKQVDAVCEVVDARIPQVSRNPDMDEIAAGRPRMMILNRIDLADPNKTAVWAKHFRDQGMAVIQTDSRAGTGTQAFSNAVRTLLADKIEQWNEKGLVGKAVRVMVVGIPNVGKSTFINRILGRKSAKAADRPGVTRGSQWFRVDSGIDLLDTPGILWPKFDDERVGILLACTGAIKDDILDVETLGCKLMELLSVQAPQTIVDRYSVSIPEEEFSRLRAAPAGRKATRLPAARRRDRHRAHGAHPARRVPRRRARPHHARDARGGRARSGRMTWEYEERAWKNGFEAVCGVDEAGRGPVAGPVCAAAVILPGGIVIEGLNDSKKLSEKKREKLFDEITENALAWSVSLVDERVIDEINILQATFRAMRQAVDGLTRPADFVYVDGNRSQGLDLPHECVVSRRSRPSRRRPSSRRSPVTG